MWLRKVITCASHNLDELCLPAERPTSDEHVPGCKQTPQLRSNVLIVIRVDADAKGIPY